MDRRQLKTRKAIFTAFRTLLLKKRYENITVQEIIDEADIGRSTFYAHFETKDLLLDAMCEEIFHHIFEYDPCTWEGHDSDLEDKLAHVLWHIRDAKNDISGILMSESGNMFMKYFEGHLRTLLEENLSITETDVPREFLFSHLTASFSSAVLWWIREKMQTAPETLSHYFISVTGLDKYTSSNI